MLVEDFPRFIMVHLLLKSAVFRPTYDYFCSVEYETEKQAAESIQYCNGVGIFGHKVTVQMSTLEFSQHGAEFRLLDGTPNFFDFSQNRNNRFLTDEAASKNRLSKGTNKEPYV